MILVERIEFLPILLQGSLRTADVFPVVASLPPKNNVGFSRRVKLEAKKRMLSQATTKAASRLVRPRPGYLTGGGCRLVSIKRVLNAWKSSLGSTHAHRVINFPTTISGRKLRSNVNLLCFDVSNIIRWHSCVLAFYAHVH